MGTNYTYTVWSLVMVSCQRKWLKIFVPEKIELEDLSSILEFRSFETRRKGVIDGRLFYVRIQVKNVEEDFSVR